MGASRGVTHGVRLLLDENLSPKLVTRVRDRFPQSLHVDHVGLRGAEDRVLWEFALMERLTIVS